MELEFIDEEEYEENADEPYVPMLNGPLRQHEKARPCASTFTSTRGRNCGSTTYYTLNNIPTCTRHALLQLNHMYNELHERTTGN